MNTNIILNTDSYKTSHYRQYPPGTQYVSSYIESRGTDRGWAGWNSLVFFGLQIFLKEYMSQPITMEMINEAEDIITAHGLTFNREGWEHILEEHEGFLPIRIRAVPEGTIVPLHNVLVQVQNTDPKVPWLTSYVETAILRAVWYPITVATQSWYIKQDIRMFLEETSVKDPDVEVLFKLHDFGSRGVSSKESAGIGGCAHLVNFMGTDTIEALLYAKRYYDEDMAGFSIPAAEHSTITAWGGPEQEIEAFYNMLNQFAVPGKLVAVVSDSYDIYHACEKLWGEELKDIVTQSGATVVIRPDSGDPVEVTLKVVNILMDKFGFTTNYKGYKVLPDCVRIIQGDGVNEKSILQILYNFKQNGISTENIAFGMGGALLQGLNRDTLQFAMKASAICVDGEWRDVWKKPITDSGKDSKRGRLGLRKTDTGFETVREEDMSVNEDILQVVYWDGIFMNEQSFAEIRERTVQ